MQAASMRFYVCSPLRMGGHQLTRGSPGPTTPYSFVENGKFGYVGYTGVFNVLDYPAVSFPCGVHSDKSVDVAYANHTPLSEVDAQVQTDCT